ncbi:hypothetical protein [Paraburkholderia bryophila]|uniref:Uncharacterized protein n=1 Tax=Paraburkholderia bryophila TaxID=420952 RepID=A0A7Y9WID0_9BURK|nr:hypothetical protein [Paraburkholderia bryophila]NYH21401.1 hypothetical protein [Paraburkholderia bryophila]
MRLPEQRDPMIIVQERQETTCAGCRDLNRDYTPGFRKFLCQKGIQKAQQDVFNMIRCNRYRAGNK